LDGLNVHCLPLATRPKRDRIRTCIVGVVTLTYWATLYYFRAGFEPATHNNVWWRDLERNRILIVSDKKYYGVIQKLTTRFQTFDIHPSR